MNKAFKNGVLMKWATKTHKIDDKTSLTFAVKKPFRKG